ncbi:hypothetical protein MKW98_002560 [Papaver atlanticum]|uniref:Uncharacterized protein n=1 Tax=Papaver atlanticum TaxID=357466 RepID=A0AAD4XB66_9MAGN|nr:hypothetical protein MKW98_002560 [Papaver atlanticum]
MTAPISNLNLGSVLQLCLGFLRFWAKEANIRPSHHSRTTVQSHSCYLNFTRSSMRKNYFPPSCAIVGYLRPQVSEFGPRFWCGSKSQVLEYKTSTSYTLPMRKGKTPHDISLKWDPTYSRGEVGRCSGQNLRST